MAEIVIKCPPHLVESFCDWFSNSTEWNTMDVITAYMHGWNKESN